MPDLDLAQSTDSWSGTFIASSIARCNLPERWMGLQMKRILSAVAAAAVVIWTATGGALAAGAQQDFSKLDPAWAAEETDTMLQESDLGSAWAALKAVFPEDYTRLTQDIANAIIQGRDWSGISQTFIQNHVAGQTPAAQRAPARQQAKYQRLKAEFLTFLSQDNVNACAYLGTGVGDPSILGSLSSVAMKRYSDLISATVETIGAGLNAPVTYGEITPDDVLKIKAIMTSQGVSDEDARRVRSVQTSTGTTELCRAGIIRHNALAAAPAEITAKVAFR